MKRSLINTYILGELIDIVGREHVLSDEADRRIYGSDYFWVPRLCIDSGGFPPIPDVVVLPANTQEIAAVLKVANVYHIPVTPWGGGSGSQGGAMPVYGGITIDVKRLGCIIEINPVAQFVTAEAGISGYELECALNAAGFTLGHLPASIHSATLGGYVAARGSGVLSTKYGKMEDIVMSLEVVLPTGEVIETLPVPSHAAGPGILQLFVGAEGSFGIITRVTSRIERLPEERRFYAYLFSSLSQALAAGREIMLLRLNPSVMRLYDSDETRKQVKKILNLDVDDRNYFVIGLEGLREDVAWKEKRVRNLCAEFGGEELNNDKTWEWWNHRYNFYFPPHVADIPKMFGTMDTLCTFDKIEHLYTTKKRVLEEAYGAHGLEYIAHFSHWFPWGVMIYDRFFIERPPADPEEALLLHNEIWNLAVRTSIRCGGVLNEHHGVGLKLARLVREQYGAAFQVLADLKETVDPLHILNPGKMGFGPTR